MRAIIAMDGRASVTAGRTRCSGDPTPPTGRIGSQNAKTTMRTRPVQNTGIDSPKSEESRDSASKSELGHTAETIPVATPTTAASRSAATVSWSVAGHASPSSSTTGRFCWMDRPRSPVTTCPRYRT